MTDPHTVWTVRPADLLLDEPRPLVVRRKLAHRIGLQEAIQLVQLHWLLDHYDSRSVQLDGRQWLKADVAFWCEQFPWSSEATIRRVFDRLRTLGLVERNRGREASVYAINYEAVDALVGIAQSDLADMTTRADGTAQDERAPSKGERTAEREEEETAGDDGSPQLFAAPGPSPSPAQSAPKDGITQEMVESVWSHYVERFSARLRIKGLTEARERVIRKALKAVGAESEPDVAVDICNAAIDGLQSYRTTKPGSTDISTIFETNMHSRSNLTDQIEWWAGQSQTTLPSRDATGGGSHQIPVDLSGVPSVTKGRIQSERRHVVKMIAHPSAPGTQDRGRKALDWLREVVGHAPVMEDGALRGWEQA